MISRSTFLKGALASMALTSIGSAHAKPQFKGGVAYETGLMHSPGSPLSRLVWNRQLMEREIRTIRDDLRCTSMTAFGTDIGRQTDVTRFATSHGLRTFVQPRLYDHSQTDVLEHLAESARQVERIRRGDDVVFVTGCEHFLFTQGIVPGETYLERIAYLEKLPDGEWPKIVRRLTDFITRAVDVARRNFRGKITYGATTDEPVDWNLFDIIGLDYYEYFETQQEYTQDLAKYQKWQKPLMILEFGSCTYVGAPQRGGMGWDAIDWEAPRPKLKPGIVRSEREQAQHISRMLGVFTNAGVTGAHVYNFISADVPHHPTCPELDLDTGSYSLVKTIRQNYDDDASPYRWERKQSFDALARHNQR